MNIEINGIIHTPLKEAPTWLTNFITWLKTGDETFEGTTKEYEEETYYTRLLKEEKELSKKLLKLKSFIKSNKFQTISENHKDLLEENIYYLDELLNIITDYIHLLDSD